SIPKFADGSPALSKGTGDLRLVVELSGEAPLQSVNRQSITNELKQVMSAVVTSANRRSSSAIVGAPELK
ncbi:hypothetical protein HAX54_053002, partial [Datura stramonium]|nr:hypothetical protein [Datura stramonium]